MCENTVTKSAEDGSLVHSFELNKSFGDKDLNTPVDSSEQTLEGTTPTKIKYLWEEGYK